MSSEPASFGLESFFFEPLDEAGALDARAGARPRDHIGVLPTHGAGKRNSAAEYAPPQWVKNVVVQLPLGLVGDPLAAKRCTLTELNQHTFNFNACPKGSRIGTVLFGHGGSPGLPELSAHEGVPTSEQTISALYNMTPEGGYPAEFGFDYLGFAATMEASVVPSGSGYALRVAVPGIVKASPITGVALTFFGDPAAQDGVEGAAAEGAAQAFLTNPADCSADPLDARIEADSWEEPDRWSSAEQVDLPAAGRVRPAAVRPVDLLSPRRARGRRTLGLHSRVGSASGAEPAEPARHAACQGSDGDAARGRCDLAGSGRRARRLHAGRDRHRHGRRSVQNLHEAGAGELLGPTGSRTPRQATARNPRKSGRSGSRRHCWKKNWKALSIWRSRATLARRRGAIRSTRCWRSTSSSKAPASWSSSRATSKRTRARAS